VIHSIQQVSGRTLTNNIIVSNFSGSLQTTDSGQKGNAYIDSGSVTIADNAYTNYGGSVYANGNNKNDSSPVTLSPSQLGLSGYTYALASNSPVFSQISFQPIKGGWGPPGFVIPSSSNHSDP